ncbi:TBC1 domain family member 15 [Morus notabilis]|uniref:TBC1 domain family member 15 n=1 Tax=Morus notabilis TaxID=981085 RepID=W9SB08_9ROSA|nr:TBC1 domain family member 15 [Morus notabilis]
MQSAKVSSSSRSSSLKLLLELSSLVPSLHQCVITVKTSYSCRRLHPLFRYELCYYFRQELKHWELVSYTLPKFSCMKHNIGEEAATGVGNFELINLEEFDKLALVWGKPRQPPLGPEEWVTLLDSEGRVTDPEALRKRIFYGGVEHILRKEVWAFLLGHYAYESTYAEREYLRSVKKSEYETIKNQWQGLCTIFITLPHVLNVVLYVQSISPQQAKKFTKFRERKGLIDKDVVRTDRSLSFYDGDDNPNVCLLRDILLTYSFYNFDLGYCQGMSDLLSPILFVMGDESESFWCFVSLMERLGPNFNRDQNGMHTQLFAISKFSGNISLAYGGSLGSEERKLYKRGKRREKRLSGNKQKVDKSWNNSKQGRKQTLELVELLDSPLHSYFKQHDCLNYFFCFRWVLIQFKREFEYEKTMRLWEVLWTHYLSEHLHLYLCVAILKRQRNKIISEQMDFDTLLKFINELSGHIDLDSVLRDAEALCICAGENGAACIPPGTPPSLPIADNGLLYPQEDDVL